MGFPRTPHQTLKQVLRAQSPKPTTVGPPPPPTRQTKAQEPDPGQSAGRLLHVLLFCSPCGPRPTIRPHSAPSKFPQMEIILRSSIS